MDAKDLPPLTRFGQYTANLLLGGMVRLALALPYKTRLRLIGAFGSRVLSPLAGWRKRIRANLSYVWPDLPEDEVERIVRAVPGSRQVMSRVR